MLFPALYRENLFDGLDPFDRMLNGQSAWGLEFPNEKRDPLFGKHAARVMRTGCVRKTAPMVARTVLGL